MHKLCAKRIGTQLAPTWKQLRFDLWACLHRCMPWDFWLIFLFLGVVLPWRGRQRVRQLMAIPEVTGRDRIRLYISTILFQWALAIVVGWRAFARGLSWRDMGLTREFTSSILLITVAGATLIAILHWMNVRRMAHSDHPAIESLRALGSRLFPRQAAEFAFYILLASTAGICEEFIFRGFMIAALFRAGLSTLPVVVISSAMFGVAHLYQGTGGSVGTALLGMLFAATRIAYGSLLPVVIWHAVLDIIAGVAGSKYFVRAAVESE
jgi:membrane protease YdiL (CAAX protease family)